MPLTAQIVARSALDPRLRDAMAALHARHFDRASRDRFLHDLADKDWVILLRNEAGAPAGFSTQALLTLAVAGRPVRFLFSGDTIVDPACWNTPLLAGAFGHLMLRLMESHGEESLYWFLISKGYRTYRFLPVFFRDYGPAPGRAMPPETAALLHAVATHRFGKAYDPVTGLIRLPDGDRLNARLAQVPAGRLRDPHVSFFLGRNPAYARGDELACLAPIRRDNLNRYAWRVIRETHPEWSP